MEQTALSADVAVIGFGKGGKTVAHALADVGKRVVMVEQSENMYGDTCPNVGCVPTKMLVHYSDGQAQDAMRAECHRRSRRRPTSAHSKIVGDPSSEARQG
jgi:pyruvate/2-oxoglutarate dehydrogenase complex dihydrolipoamide dehydrogenase (E3) component